MMNLIRKKLIASFSELKYIFDFVPPHIINEMCIPVETIPLMMTKIMINCIINFIT